MRTDGTKISKEALPVFRNFISDNFGNDYLPDEPINYSGKKAKNAQEAHEAIRPAGEVFKTPKETTLTGKINYLLVCWNWYTWMSQKPLSSDMSVRPRPRVENHLIRVWFELSYKIHTISSVFVAKKFSILSK